jgi:hypothetical protein
MKLPYNPKDKKSVIDYAKLLKGKTLRASLRPKYFRTQLHRQRKLWSNT